MIDFLTVDDLLEVARRTAGGGVRIRDAGLLASAAARPALDVPRIGSGLLSFAE